MRWKQFQYIDADLKDRVLTLRLNRPDKLNAVNRVLHNEISRMFGEAASDPACDIVVLTGAGRAFSAGGDLEFLDLCIKNHDVFDEVAIEGKQIVYSMLDCEKPIIGKINGHAAGLGATLALFCDVTFVADHAKISDPHVRVGLAAGDGGAVIWPQLIGYARAKEYLMTGNAIAAPDAARIGLVNHAVPADELDGRVEAFVQQLLNGAMSAIRATKVSVNVGLKQLAHTVLETSTALEQLSNRSREHRLAIDAMLKKETPVFRPPNE
jgi:enoyl-CoA hydratase